MHPENLTYKQIRNIRQIIYKHIKNSDNTQNYTTTFFNKAHKRRSVDHIFHWYEQQTPYTKKEAAFP